MKQGIDIHGEYQSSVDFKKVKASGIDFVILHAGYGDALSYPGQKDPKFEQYYKEAKAAGLNVGVYWYSYARSVEAAVKEAKSCLTMLSGKQFEYPIYFDLEEPSQFAKGRSFCNSIVKAFCNELEKAGYYAGLYISRSPLQTYISSDVADRYTLWIAEYGSKLNWNKKYGIWQNSSTWAVNGIKGNVDHDYSYIDFPRIIKESGLNGFKKPTAALKSEPVKGDLNGDGRVNVTDAALLTAHIKGKNALSGEALAEADVNGDGKVDVADAAVVANKVKNRK